MLVCLIGSHLCRALEHGGLRAKDFVPVSIHANDSVTHSREILQQMDNNFGTSPLLVSKPVSTVTKSFVQTPSFRSIRSAMASVTDAAP